jgi:beta-lactamase superfamily II metal-dependent hydrolase
LVQIDLAPPKPSQTEISLFGPGIGECIVLKYNDNDWFIIDSCLCPNTKEPIALKYLESLGVDFSTQVKGLVITHWHQDHIAGSDKILELCKEAKLYISKALVSKEAFNFSNLSEIDNFTKSSIKSKELNNIAKYIKSNNLSAIVERVSNNHSFFNFLHNKTRLLALSPSNTAVTDSINEFASRIYNKGDSRTQSITTNTPNLNAIALYFSVGNFSAILGSDLEIHNQKYIGWNAVFNGGNIQSQSVSPSNLYKVSHHGSKTANHEDIWNKLLAKNPISITTPFSRSKLPKNDQIEYIKNKSSRFIVTNSPNGSGKNKYNKVAERHIKNRDRKRVTINKIMGHIQIRIDENGSYIINKSSSTIEY